MTATVARPEAIEYAPFYDTYVSKVPEGNLLETLEAQRRETQALLATIALLRSLDTAALARRGTANGKEVSVRALAYIIAGHERHHLAILRERYGV